MNLAPLVEGDLPQRLISGFWQVDTGMLDVRARPAGFAAALSLPAGDRRRFGIKALLRPL